MNNSFTDFNKNFFNSFTGYNIQWFDMEGIIEFDDNRLVSIKLDNIGTHNQFNGYWVEIINKQRGTIYKKFFKFKDYMDFKHRDDGMKFYYARFDTEELDWYISRPKSTKPMLDAISMFINKFY